MVSRRFGKKAKVRTKKSGFVYRKRSVADVKERAERKGGGLFDSIVKPGFDMWRPKEGSNLIRFLPPTWDDHKHYGYSIWVHTRIGANTSNYLCPQKMLNKRCPVCEAANEARKQGDEDEAKEMSPKEQIAYYILDRDNDNPHPQVYVVGWMQDREIVNQCYSDRTGKALFIDHPTDGYDVTVKRTGKMLQTRYSFVIEREQTSIFDNEDDQEEVLSFISENPIPSVLKYYSPEYLAKVIEGTSEKDEDEDEDDKVLQGAARKKKKIVEEEDDEEEVDEDEDEDEDEEPAPKRRRKVKEEPEDEEDEDEDEDEEEDEEEEDEKPKPRRGVKPKKRPDPEEEEDEDEDEEDDDEEEDEKPKPRRGRKVVEEEEDEDDEGEDDEEEDEKPEPKRRGRKVVEEEDEEDEDEEEEEEDEEEEEEDEKPRRRSVPAKKKAPPAKREKPAVRKKVGRTSRR